MGHKKWVVGQIWLLSYSLLTLGLEQTGKQGNLDKSTNCDESHKGKDRKTRQNNWRVGQGSFSEESPFKLKVE